MRSGGRPPWRNRPVACPGGRRARQEIDQRRHLGGADLFAVRRHVAAAGRAVADLVDELAAQSVECRRLVRSGPRFPPRAFQGVTVAAVLVLEHDRPLQLPAACILRTMSTGTGSPLQAVICGDQGDVAPW